MRVHLNSSLAGNFKSASQKIRILSENWVNQEIFCPSCGTPVIKFENNRPAADFFCPNCKEEFELKSQKNGFGNKIVNGAYRTMVERINSSQNPNFFLLSYDRTSWKVSNFLVIPKHFFITDVIEKRKPLSKNARRAGWVGCNILLRKVPFSGRIFYIKNHRIEPKTKIIDCWNKFLFLRKKKEPKAKGWILHIMNCIETINQKEFTLDQIYNFEAILRQKFPDNRHIKEKIRQQLQYLRNNGYLEFLGKGKYRLI